MPPAGALGALRPTRRGMPSGAGTADDDSDGPLVSAAVDQLAVLAGLLARRSRGGWGNEMVCAGGAGSASGGKAGPGRTLSE